MNKYIYKAYDSEFNIIKDIAEEEDINVVTDNIKAKGWTLIDIHPSNTFTSSFKFNKLIKEDELANYCGQIATIVESGINLIKGIEILADQTKVKKYKVIYNKILTDIKRGRTLSEAMESTGKFPRLLNEMVKAGLMSGNLETILYTMESYFQQELNIKNKIKSATVYPKILIFAAFGMIIFFDYFIMPIFKGLFGTDVELPLYTRFLLNSTDFINQHIILFLLSIFILFIAIRSLLMLNKVKIFKDYVVFKIPGFGMVQSYVVVARITRTLAIFLKSAVPIFSALDSIATIVDNEHVASKMKLVKGQIMTGQSIANAFDNQKLFDPLVIQMIRVGEETGRLEDMLMRLAEIYDKKLEVGIAKLMAMVEPLFTLIVGIFVGSIVIAMAIPILTMSQNVK